jgi:hypothetical protein
VFAETSKNTQTKPVTLPNWDPNVLSVKGSQSESWSLDWMVHMAMM